MLYPTSARFATVSVPGLTAEYARLPPGTGPSITAGHAIGVAITPQRRATWCVGSCVKRSERRCGPLAPGTVFVAPAEGLDWSEWTDVSESVEMWLDADLLSETSMLAGGPSRVKFEYHEVRSDPVIVNVASMVRQLLLSGAPSATRLEPTAAFLAEHVLERYHGLRLPRSGPIRRLDRSVLARVAEYIDAHLQRPVTLLELARLAGRSPHHFAKAFKASTGSAPHAYLAARRMERALVLLQQTQNPVKEIARLVGFESLTHFRSRFRRAWGETTGAYRTVGRPRRAA